MHVLTRLPIQSASDGQPGVDGSEISQLAPGAEHRPSDPGRAPAEGGAPDVTGLDQAGETPASSHLPEMPAAPSRPRPRPTPRQAQCPTLEVVRTARVVRRTPPRSGSARVPCIGPRPVLGRFDRVGPATGSVGAASWPLGGPAEAGALDHVGGCSLRKRRVRTAQEAGSAGPPRGADRGDQGDRGAVRSRPVQRPSAGLEDISTGTTTIVEAWFLGVQAGPAVSDVVFGKVNPGGKLPVSFPYRVGQVPI